MKSVFQHPTWSDDRSSGVIIEIVTFLPKQVSLQHYGGRRLDPALIIMRRQAHYVTFYIKCCDLRRLFSRLCRKDKVVTVTTLHGNVVTARTPRTPLLLCVGVSSLQVSVSYFTYLVQDFRIGEMS